MIGLYLHALVADGSVLVAMKYEQTVDYRELDGMAQPSLMAARNYFMSVEARVQHRRRNRWGNGGARPLNAETAGAKISFRPRRNDTEFNEHTCS